MLYIATHKSSLLPKTDWLIPIGLSGYTDPDVQISDSTGHSISHLNRNYCELTATYWLEKNCNDTYIGLCHYRRLFSFIPLEGDQIQYPSFIETKSSMSAIELCASSDQKNQMLSILNSYDVITPRPVHQTDTISSSFIRSHGKYIWDLFINSCEVEFGADIKYFEHARNFHYGNMIVAEASTFKNYSASLFRVINRVFDVVGDINDIEGERYQPCRYPGYLAERFTGFYIYANRMRNFEASSLWLT